MHPQSREVLQEVATALDDWILTYAPEWCGEDEVSKARERIYANGGTLSYITQLREKLDHVLKNEE